LAFQNERGNPGKDFLNAVSFESLHEGLMAGDRLELAFRTMEHAYKEENCREYELTKHFSRKLHFPVAFLQLKTDGCCEID
jgi:hypothetical protein